MLSVSQVKQAAPVQEWYPGKATQAEAALPALAHQEKKNINTPVVCFQSFGQGSVGSHQAGTAGLWRSALRDPHALWGLGSGLLGQTAAGLSLPQRVEAAGCTDRAPRRGRWALERATHGESEG